MEEVYPEAQKDTGNPNPDILQHLLEVEAKAAALVEDAQAETDRRLKEAEEQNRRYHDEQYQSLVRELEEESHRQVEAAGAEYREQLEDYRKSLDAIQINAGAFSALAFSLFFGER